MRSIQTTARVGLVAAVCGLSACNQPHPASGQASHAQAPRPAARDPLTAASIMKDVRWLCDPDRAGRGSYQPGGRAAADYMADELRRAGLDVTRQPVRDGADNVIAVLPGTRDADTAVIISAHYDHLGIDADGVIYPGADDNASGAAVLLALARHACCDRRFDRTLIFIAFGAEEVGLVGSRAYIAHPLWPLDRTRAVVNFDMVGRNFFESGVNRQNTAAVIGLQDDPAARRAVDAAARDSGLHVIVTPPRLLTVFGVDFRTDEWWFRHQGVPAIHFSTGLHDDYHRPSDTVQRLVPDQMMRIARTAAGLIEHLANDASSGSEASAE